MPTTAERPLRLIVRQVLESNGTISSERFEDEVLSLLDAAVHEAYVNAQRAVAALSCDPRPASRDHVRGMMRMQEDAVRAIREAAEENR